MTKQDVPSRGTVIFIVIAFFIVLTVGSVYLSVKSYLDETENRKSVFKECRGICERNDMIQTTFDSEYQSMKCRTKNDIRENYWVLQDEKGVCYLSK